MRELLLENRDLEEVSLLLVFEEEGIESSNWWLFKLRGPVKNPVFCWISLLVKGFKFIMDCKMVVLFRGDDCIGFVLFDKWDGFIIGFFI